MGIRTAEAAGPACIVRSGNDKPVVIAIENPPGSAAGAKQTGSYLPLADCTGVRILQGSGSVYFSTGARRPAGNRPFREGELLTIPSTLEAEGDTGWPSFITLFARMLGVTETNREARSRGAGDRALEMLPYGRVLPSASPLRVDITTLETPLDSIRIERASGRRNEVFRQDRPGGTLEIPLQSFTRGLDYAWFAGSGGSESRGTFHVLSDDEAAAVEAAAPPATAPASAGASFERALFLQSQGLEYDATRILAEIARRQGR